MGFFWALMRSWIVTASPLVTPSEQRTAVCLSSYDSHCDLNLVWFPPKLILLGSFASVNEDIVEYLFQRCREISMLYTPHSLLLHLAAVFTCNAPSVSRKLLLKWSKCWVYFPVIVKWFNIYQHFIKNNSVTAPYYFCHYHVNISVCISHHFYISTTWRFLFGRFGMLPFVKVVQTHMFYTSTRSYTFRGSQLVIGGHVFGCSSLHLSIVQYMHLIKQY